MPEPTPPPPPGSPPSGADSNDSTSGPNTGTARLAAALRRPWSRGQAVAGVLVGALGFAAAVQVKATNDSDQEFVGARQADLIALINTLSVATDRAEAEIEELRQTRDDLRGDAESARTAVEVARRRAESLGILAGTVAAEGPGVRVVVEASSDTVGTDQLLNGLQELRNAGAEAIELNDSVRVVAQSGITESGSGDLVVDGTRLEAPYTVEAIGDPGTLSTALEFDGGFIDEVEEVGGRVRVQQLDAIEVTTTRSPPTPTFAEPVDQE